LNVPYRKISRFFADFFGLKFVPATAYGFERQAAQALLGERFGGVLVADAYASYNGLRPKDRQSCLAHIKTKAKELDQELALLQGRAVDLAARQFCQDILKPLDAKGKSPTASSWTSLQKPPWRPRPLSIEKHWTQNPSQPNPSGPASLRDYPLNCYPWPTFPMSPCSSGFDPASRGCGGSPLK